MPNLLRISSNKTLNLWKPSQLENVDKQSQRAVKNAVYVFDQVVPVHQVSPSHGLDHSFRILNNYRAAKGDSVTQSFIYASILHDVKVECRDHGREAAEVLRPYLEQLKLPENDLEKIIYSIETHHNLGKTNDRIPEAKFLRFLDALDAMGHLGVFRYLEIYTRRGMEIKAALFEAHENLQRRYQYLLDNAGNPFENPSASFFNKEQIRAIYQAYAISDKLLFGFACRIESAGVLKKVFQECQWDIDRIIAANKKVQDQEVADYLVGLKREIEGWL